MPLRCLLFSSDEGTAQPVLRALLDLGFESDRCSSAVEAVHKVTTQAFQLVIVDWTNETESEFLLKTARERRAAERPLTLAITSKDAERQVAMQAGANSILGRPFTPDQVRDILRTARDLLRSRMDAPPATQKAAAGAGSAAVVGSHLPPKADVPQATLRAGEFLQSTTAPATQIVTESGVPKDLEQSATQEVDSLKNLEPTAASVNNGTVSAGVSTEPAEGTEQRGLSWYLNNRNVRSSGTPPSVTTASDKPELLGYDQTPSQSSSAPPEPATAPAVNSGSAHKKPDTLFSYMGPGESSPGEKGAEASSPWLRRAGWIIAIPVISAIIFVGARRAGVPVDFHSVLARAAQPIHNWLNPQPATPAQAPPSHENFGHAYDEYKLPVAENIPDATTDPSQIQVLPVIDPTAKQPNSGSGNSAQPAADADSTGLAPDAAQKNTQGEAPQPTSPSVTTPNSTESAPPAAITAATPDTTQPAAREPQVPAPAPRDPMRPPVQKIVPVRPPAPATQGIPSSLRSQLAPTTGATQVNGNKALETVLPSIEPVSLPESAARSLLLQQVEPVYPANAKNQIGKVMLQVLIGRDGTVQDAKFLQGSLAFARAAIDAVRHWQFKPYVMNGRPVSVQTLVTLQFKPAQ